MVGNNVQQESVHFFNSFSVCFRVALPIFPRLRNNPHSWLYFLKNKGVHESSDRSGRENASGRLTVRRLRAARLIRNCHGAL